MGVFELAEGELGFGLGAVAGHYLGDGPVLVVGDQDTLAEDLGFQVSAGLVVDMEGESVLGWGVTSEFPADDASDPGVFDDPFDLGGDLVVAAAGLAPGQDIGQF